MCFYFRLLPLAEFRALTVPQMRHALGSQGLDGVATDAARRRNSTRAIFSVFSVFPKTASQPEESICASVRLAADANWLFRLSSSSLGQVIAVRICRVFNAEIRRIVPQLRPENGCFSVYAKSTYTRRLS